MHRTMRRIELAKAKLMIVDDEADLLAELKPLLKRSGYDVATSSDGQEALELIKQTSPDLIILDVLLPHLDGREIVRQLRKASDWTPVILLTKVGAPAERAMSLQEGADDYLNKPFDPFELVARIHAILRRTLHSELPISSFRRLTSADLLIDRQTRQAWRGGDLLALTARAFGVLEFLMLHPGEIVTRDRLLDEVWGWTYAVESRAVDIRIAELRKLLQDDAADPHVIETVIGLGYRFIGEVKASD